MSYLTQNYECVDDIRKAMTNLLATAAKNHDHLCGYDNELELYAEAFVSNAGCSLLIDSAFKTLMSKFIEVLQLQEHSGVTMFVHRVYPCEAVEDKMYAYYTNTTMDDALRLVKSFIKREKTENDFKLRFHIFDYDNEIELCDDGIRKMATRKYRICFRTYDKDGKGQQPRADADTIEEACKIFDELLSPENFNDSDAKRVLDMRPYSNVVKGVRYEWNNGDATELVILDVSD